MQAIDLLRTLFQQCAWTHGVWSQGIADTQTAGMWEGVGEMNHHAGNNYMIFHAQHIVGSAEVLR